MKVKEFVDRYVGYVNYATDRKMIEKYGDEELRIYAACGAQDGQWKSYFSVMVFDTARLTVAFINGERTNDMRRALKLVQSMDMVAHTPVKQMKQLKKRVVLESF